MRHNSAIQHPLGAHIQSLFCKESLPVALLVQSGALGAGLVPDDRDVRNVDFNHLQQLLFDRFEVWADTCTFGDDFAPGDTLEVVTFANCPLSIIVVH